MYLYLCIYIIYIYAHTHRQPYNIQYCGMTANKTCFFGKLMLNVDIKPHVGESILGEAWLATRGHEQRATEQGAGSPWGSRLFTGSGSLGQCIFQEPHVVSSRQIQHGKPWKAISSRGKNILIILANSISMILNPPFLHVPTGGSAQRLLQLPLGFPLGGAGKNSPTV